jgi:hypothetical protein
MLPILAYHRRNPEIADNRATDGYCPRTPRTVTDGVEQDVYD